MPLKLEIITPEKRVYEDTVDAVSFMTRNGEVDILPGHMPLLTMLLEGELRAHKGGRTDALAVSRGFARVMGDTVSILTDAAIDVEAIDASAVEEAQKRAQQALEKARLQKDVDEAELERLEAVSRFAIAQLLTKRRNPR